MYVSLYNNLDEVFHVSDDIKSSWSALWQEANAEFDAILQRNSNLAIFVDKPSVDSLLEAHQQSSPIGQRLAYLC